MAPGEPLRPLPADPGPSARTFGPPSLGNVATFSRSRVGSLGCILGHRGHSRSSDAERRVEGARQNEELLD